MSRSSTCPYSRIGRAELDGLRGFGHACPASAQDHFGDALTEPIHALLPQERPGAGDPVQHHGKTMRGAALPARRPPQLRATRSTWHWHQAPCRSPASRQQPGSASQGTARTGNLSTNHSRPAMRGRHEHGVQQLVLGESLHCSGGRAACDDQPAEAPHGHGDLCCERPGPAGFPDDEPEQEQH